MSVKEECLICGAPLVYGDQEEEMECAVCHRKERARIRCRRGHYVCDDCHMAGLDAVRGICLRSSSKNPLEILEEMMEMPFCHMHGPEHHVMVGAALLAAAENAGAGLDLDRALSEMMSRGRKVPGGACGFWGACGAGISTGMFVSILTGSTPMGEKNYGLSNQMTARALSAIGRVGGPRCCKRNSYLAVHEAIAFCRENLGIEMEEEETVCARSPENSQCLGKRCPFRSGQASRSAGYGIVEETENRSGGEG